jgi:hypothetical protein
MEDNSNPETGDLVFYPAMLPRFKFSVHLITWVLLITDVRAVYSSLTVH